MFMMARVYIDNCAAYILTSVLGCGEYSVGMAYPDISYYQRKHGSAAAKSAVNRVHSYKFYGTMACKVSKRMGFDCSNCLRQVAWRTLR